MTNQEIKQKIDYNNMLLEQLVKPGQFVLNQEVQDLLEENDILRAKCGHEFVNGYCIYCMTKENN